MPVIHLPAYPNTQVHTTAGVIVHNNMIFRQPMLMGTLLAGDQEVFEFGMCFFQNVDWNARVDISLPADRHQILFVDTPGGMLTLERFISPI